MRDWLTEEGLSSLELAVVVQAAENALLGDAELSRPRALVQARRADEEGVRAAAMQALATCVAAYQKNAELQAAIDNARTARLEVPNLTTEHKKLGVSGTTDGGDEVLAEVISTTAASPPTPRMESLPGAAALGRWGVCCWLRGGCATLP